jgi:hypothetical protein
MPSPETSTAIEPGCSITPGSWVEYE